MSVFFGEATPGYLLNPGAGSAAPDAIPGYVAQADPAANYVGDGTYVDPASGSTVITNAARPATSSWWDSFTGGASIHSDGTALTPSENTYAAQPVPSMIPDDSGGTSGGGFLSALTSIFSSVAQGTIAASSMVNIHGQPTRPYNAPPPQPATPVWVVPAAVVLGGLLLVVVVKKKGRKSSMRGYRRRSRR